METAVRYMIYGSIPPVMPPPPPQLNIEVPPSRLFEGICDFNLFLLLPHFSITDLAAIRNNPAPFADVKFISPSGGRSMLVHSVLLRAASPALANVTSSPIVDRATKEDLVTVITVKDQHCDNIFRLLEGDLEFVVVLRFIFPNCCFLQKQSMECCSINQTRELLISMGSQGSLIRCTFHRLRCCETLMSWYEEFLWYIITCPTIIRIFPQSL